MNRIVSGIVSLCVLGCGVGPKAEPERVYRAPNVLLVDESLIGVTLPELEERFGPACLKQGEGALAGWPVFENTILGCVPGTRVLGVYFEGGRSTGYYVGAAP